MDEDDKDNNNCVRIGDHKFIIKHDGKYLTVSPVSINTPNNKLYPWIDKLNCKSMINSYDVTKLKKVLQEYCDKQYSDLSSTKPLEKVGIKIENKVETRGLDKQIAFTKESMRLKELVNASIKSSKN